MAESETSSATSAGPIEMPMFPLGSVLFPGGVLPLHVFEIRYQQLLNRVLETDRRFGVVLISRGSEVGGGDERYEIGTIASVREHQRYDDGRAAVVSEGVGRFQVIEWLPDDPFPRAMVRETPSEPVGSNDRSLIVGTQQQFDELVVLGRELGRLASVPEAEWIAALDDPAGCDDATWQLANRAPCSALDRYAILAAPTRAARVTRISQVLADVRTDLELMGRLDDPT